MQSEHGWIVDNLVAVVNSSPDRAEEETVFNKNNSKTVVIKTKNYVGEYTTLQEETIHLSVTRREKELPVMRMTHITIPEPERRPRTRTPWDSDFPYLFLTSTAGPEMPQRKMNAVLSALDTPKTWTELRGEVPVSKATLASRMKQLQKMSLVDKQKQVNGTTKYTLTGVAQELRKRKPEK
jgi:hypothetical protein